jgi:hypothetical protein
VTGLEASTVFCSHCPVKTGAGAPLTPEEIARLRQDRAELDDMADDYDERHAELTAKIRQLAKDDKESPQPDEVKWVPSELTIEEYWQALSTAARRDWLLENSWKVYVSKRDGEYVVTIDAGFTAQSAARQMNTLGIPLSEMTLDQERP